MDRFATEFLSDSRFVVFASAGVGTVKPPAMLQPVASVSGTDQSW